MKVFNFNHCRVYEFFDSEIQLRAFIAIHQLANGQAIGGCRMLPYSNRDAALNDVARLARAMSAKTAAANIPFGGAKAVLIKPENITNRNELFGVYAAFVNKLEGQYITGCDSGVCHADMVEAKKYSPFITGLSLDGKHDYLIELTALGVITAIRTTVNFLHGKSSLSGMKVVIQGVGKVGFNLAKLLINEGCEVVVADVSSKAVEHCTQNLPVKVCNPESVLAEPCDILIPCALGEIFTQDSIQMLNTRMICGAANNQLVNREVADEIAKKNITYIPDYIANAGGAIYAADSYQSYPVAAIRDRVINTINYRVEEILQKAKKENTTPTTAARGILMGILLERGIKQIKADQGAWWIDQEKLIA